MQKTENKKIFVLGALGAGKSTVLNVISSAAIKGLGRKQLKFVASNQLLGCTQNFHYDDIPLQNGEQIILIDSPGLADPNILIDQWVQIYNEQFFSKNQGIDLVVVVIEFAQRPSTKEHQVFAVLNQALAEIKSENLVILFNKCSRGVNQAQAKKFYEACCKQIDQTKSKFPILTSDNFLVLQNVGNVPFEAEPEELEEAQQEVNMLLKDDVCKFVFSNLAKVTVKTQPKQADRQQLADSFLDKASREEMVNQRMQFEAQKKDLEVQMQKNREKYAEFEIEQKKKEEENRKALEKLRQEMQKTQEDSKKIQDESLKKQADQLSEFNKKSEEHQKKIQQLEEQKNEIKQVVVEPQQNLAVQILKGATGAIITGYGMYKQDPKIIRAGAGVIGGTQF